MVFALKMMQRRKKGQMKKMMYRRKKGQMKKCLLIQKLKKYLQFVYQVLSGNILKKSLMIVVFIYKQNATTATKNIVLSVLQLPLMTTGKVNIQRFNLGELDQ